MDKFTSDWHLGHDNLYDKSKGIENRIPLKNSKNADELLKKNIQESCTVKDTIHVLGDITIDEEPENVFKFIKSLPGNYIFYEGNHDRSQLINYLKKNNYIYNGKPKMEFKIAGKLKYNKKVYLLTHYPLDVGPRDNRYNIHGHIHGNVSNYFKHINVCIDSPEIPSDIPYGKPLTFKEVEKMVEEKAKQLEKKPVYIAWSPYLGSHIVTYKKYTNLFWRFQLCDKRGNAFGKIMWAGSKHNYFDWKKI